MAEMDIYLEFKTDENDVLLRFPVLPQQLQFVRAGSNVSSSTVKRGEVNILRKPKLMTFQIDSFFPRDASRSYIRGREKAYSPEYYETMLTWLQDNKKPAKAVFVGFDIESMYVSIESLTFQHDAGDNDLTYSLQLKEYRFYGEQAREIVTVEPLFSGTKAKLLQMTTTTRPKTDFCIGDRVIVDGAVFGDSFGAVALIPTPLDFMCVPFENAPRSDLNAIRNALPEMVSQEAVIVGYQPNGRQVSINVLGQLETGTVFDAIAPYQIAIDGKAAGWVSKSALRHV